MQENKYTPSSIGKLKFSIPLYQRLFEWDAKQIKQLLSDLYFNFLVDNKKAYYIGIFTVYKEENQKQYSLVDGQQRFTVLILLALAIRDENWNQFLYIDSKEVRLKFFARSEDTLYLENKLDNKQSLAYTNTKMENGIKVIQDFLSKDCVFPKKLLFTNYIYNNTTFFISELPENYQLPDLNRYFESMNVAGKSLENYEILKVDLLRNIASDRQEFYTRIWNAISVMSKCLIRQKNCEDKAAFNNRKAKALNSLEDVDQLFNLCNDFEKQIINNKDSIRVIEESDKKPAYKFLARNERSIINFSEFLLQILWLQLRNNNKVKKRTEFFDTSKLLKTFQDNLSTDKIDIFFDNLLKYRILFDEFIVRINQDEYITTNYFINYTEISDEHNHKNLTQYQSMLFVSTNYHIWLSQFLLYLRKNLINISNELLINHLKKWDNKRQSESFDLSYGSIDRYWFWRLDYYLWENRKKYFFDKSLEIANNYLFKANRSIEHIAPQTELENSTRLFKEELLDHFGNLTMISGGQNSSLKNQTFEVKKAHVESFIRESRNGSIESLKMLDIYESSKWDYDNLKKHNNKMLDVLIKSFDSREDIRSKLQNFKL